MYFLTHMERSWNPTLQWGPVLRVPHLFAQGNFMWESLPLKIRISRSLRSIISTHQFMAAPVVAPALRLREMWRHDVPLESDWASQLLHLYRLLQVARRGATCWRARLLKWLPEAYRWRLDPQFKCHVMRLCQKIYTRLHCTCSAMWHSRGGVPAAAASKWAYLIQYQ